MTAGQPDGLTAGKILSGLPTDVKEAVAEAVGAADLQPVELGRFLRQFQRAVLGGYRIRRIEKRGAEGFRWFADAPDQV